MHPYDLYGKDKVPLGNPLNIAVLGDLHGHFTLALAVLSRYQKEAKKTLDFILQVGDLGAWPNPLYRIDKATSRFAKSDPDEISFPDYLDQREEYHLFKDPSKNSFVEAPFMFIKGNHEDFDFLQGYELHRDEGSPAMITQDFFYIPNGRRISFQIRGKTISIAGLGGVEHASRSDDQGAEFSLREVHALENLVDVDVLLTHEPPQGVFGPTSGSNVVKDLIYHLSPTYHFCGHFHESGQKLDMGAVQSYQLNEVNFKKRDILNPGCIGILEWESKENHDFSLLDAKWLKEITKKNYKR